MKLLVINNYIPMPDRGSEELRLTEILRLLARDHEITLFVWQAWAETVGEADQRRYISDVQELGIELCVGRLHKVLTESSYDVIWIEYAETMDKFGTDIRAWQPRAKVVIDAVDLVYRRLTLKAAVSHDPQDISIAAETKRRELAAYAAADFVITVSEEEREILTKELPRVPAAALPNIHRFQERMHPLTDAPVLVFVGDYRVLPNVDAVCHFATTTFPLIRSQIFDATFMIVGNAPVKEIRDLASKNINVTGYVPETRPYLEMARVSVAPLRYGAGMKGKVGEAMSIGVPVVTTSIGIQGIDVIPEEEVLVADAPQDFAAKVVTLLSDRTLCEKLRVSARQRMIGMFSVEAAERRINNICSQITVLPPTAKISTVQRWQRKSMVWFERNLLWRLGN